jgi:hypothetical protein
MAAQSSLENIGMGERKCDWILIPALDDKVEGVCGATVEGDSRYCTLHDEEMLMAEADLAAYSYKCF